MREPQSRAEAPDVQRIEAFSDGVMAIIITIMVLNLGLAPGALDAGLWRGVLLPLAPRLAAYAWSFGLIGLMWINHHHLMATLRHATRTLGWINLHLLFWMSLVPLSTAMIGDRPWLPAAVAAYAAVHGLNTTAFLGLRAYARAQTPRETPALQAVHAAMVRRNLVGVGLYAAAAGAAFLWLPLAYGLIVAVPILFLIPPPRPKPAAAPAA